MAAISELAKRPPPLAQPELVIEPTRLDFGEVWETDKFEWSLPVRSRLGSPTTVYASGSSCNSCGATVTTAALGTGGTGELKLSLDLREPCASAEPRAVRDAKIPIYLTTNSQTRPQAIELRGRVKRAIAIPAHALDFGRLQVTTDPKPRVLSVRALMDVTELTATVDGHSVRAEVRPLEKGKWEVRVSPILAAGVGKHTATVHLAPKLVNNEAVPATAVRAEFDVLHDIQPDTSLVTLGAGSVGETVRGSLTVTSLSGRPFPRPTCNAGAIVVRATDTIASQGSHRFEFEHRVTAPGNHALPVVVRGTDADGRPFELRVEAQWYGLST